MSKFRLACRIDQYGRLTRPPKPAWLGKWENNEKISSKYWTKIYWATPPWLTPDQIATMKEIYHSTPDGCEVDHIVPLRSPIVCGLHVPWNLQHMPIKANGFKSNHMWPGHPYENHELLGTELVPHQRRLL